MELREAPDLQSSTEEYAERFAGDIGEFFLNIQTSAVLTQLPPPASCRVLDVGGGHGQLVAPLVAGGYDVTVLASDASCRTRLNRIVGAEKYHLLTGDLLDIPCERNQFDVVLAFRMLPHLHNWTQFIGELCRVSKNVLIIDYPDLRSFNIFSSLLFAFKRRIEKNTRKFSCFRRAQILAELERHGFRSIKIKGQFFLPMALHRWAAAPSFSHLTERFASACGLTACFGSPVVLTATAKTQD